LKHKALTFILQIAVFTFMTLFFTTMGYAEDSPNTLNYDLNSDGTVAIVPLNITIVDAAKDLVQQLQTSNILHISAMVYAPPSLSPYMVLSGNQSDLQEVLRMLQRILPNKTPAYLIIISASLRELTQSTSHYIGLNLVPSITGKATIDWSSGTGSSRIRTNTQQLTATSADLLSLNEALNNSKVLVASEVYTPNGIKAQISNVKSVPIFSTDSQGNVQTQFQNLETSISVTPTVVNYNENKPEESIIRIDVEVKASIISGTSTYKSVSAPEYSVKTMTTVRVLPADNQSYVIGSFITDSDVKSTSGVPILGKLPLLKYLFSQEHVEKQRNTAILALAVRMLPMVPPAKVQN
jgi:type II secretory pathway component GspD/PulD (secretin)